MTNGRRPYMLRLRVKNIVLHSALVGIGGCAGSLSRYGLSLALQRHALVMPVGTLAANWLGCFVIGAVAQLAAPVPHLSPEASLLLATGFCGGFTTLSSMIYELEKFLKEGEYGHAGAYLLLTLVGAFALFLIGGLAARGLLKLAGATWN